MAEEGMKPVNAKDLSFSTIFMVMKKTNLAILGALPLSGCYTSRYHYFGERHGRSPRTTINWNFKN